MVRLRVNIVQGRHLAVRDGLSGTSDPYVKFKFDGQKYKTSVQFETLSPKWNESFIIDVADLKSSKNKVKFEVFDKDTFSSDDFMGAFYIDFSELGDEASTDKWYTVDTAVRGEDGGKVRVVVDDMSRAPSTTRSAVNSTTTASRNYPGAAVAPYPAYPPQHVVAQTYQGYPPGAYPPPASAYPPPAATPAYPAYPHQPPVAAPSAAAAGAAAGAAAAAAAYAEVSDSSDSSDLSEKRKKKQKKAVKSVRKVVPQFTEEQVFAALYAHNFNKEAAITTLLAPPGAAPPQAHPPVAGGYPPHAAAPPAYAAAAPLAYNQYIQGPPPMMAPPTYGLQQASFYNQDYNAYSSGGGRRKALLIGINYIGQRCSLKGCISDVARMRQLLVGTYGFTQDITSMVCLCDDSPDPKFQPTRHNMIYAMKWLVGDVRTGDVLFFHFSGHGSQVRDKTGMEADGYDEVILPVDHRTAGPIIDDEIHATLVQPLPQGARLTAVMDCCHSGTGMDLPYLWKDRKQKWQEDDNPVYSQGDVQLFSGCADSQKAADVQRRGAYPQAGGAVTTAFVEALSRNPFGYKYPSLLRALQEAMWRGGLPQVPQLSSTQRFNLNRNFNLTDIVPNHNCYLGRKHQKKKMNNKKMLMVGGAGLIGGLLLGELLF